MGLSPQIKRILLFVFFIYLTFIGGTTYPERNVIILILHHLLMGGLLALSLLILFYRRQPFPQTPIDLPILAFGLWLFFTSLNSYDWRISLAHSWRLFFHIALFYLFVAWMERGRQRWLFEGLFLSVALVVVVSVAELISWYFGLGFGGLQYGWIEAMGLSHPIPPIMYRLTLALNFSTTLGNYVALTLPLVVAWMFTVRRQDDRRALGLLALGLIFTLIFSQSRGGTLGVLAALVTGYILNWWRTGGLQRSSSLRDRLEFASIILFVMGGVAVLIYVSQSRVDGDIGRAILWERAQMMLADHPITGVGSGNYGYYLSQYGEMNDTVAVLSHAHNLYLHTGAEIGWVGLALLAWLSGAFLWVWWRRWQAEPASGARIRLIGVLAALVGFSVHSIVDTFNYTANLLPLLVMAAYVMSGYYTHAKPVNFSVSPRPYYWVRAAILIVILFFFAWMLRIDVAQFRIFQSAFAEGSEDFEKALDRTREAQNLDPAFRLYDLREAYLLGLLAEDQPDEYLESAIAAYEQALETDNQFDLGFANLGALYAQNGDFTAAAAALERAAQIRPDIPIYWAKLGEYREALGETDSATIAYQEALDVYSTILASEYWQGSELRQRIWETRPQESDLLEFVYDVERRDVEAAADWVEQFQDSDDSLAHLALGGYYALIGDHEAAIEWYSKVYEKEKSGWIQAQIAKAELALGNRDEAERSAHLALFLTQSLTTRSRLYNIKWLSGYEAHAILADPDSSTYEDELLQAVNPATYLKSYDSTVLGAAGYWDYLPQLAPPGLGEYAFEPWLELADYFATDDDPDTDPILVYQVILYYEPSAPTARALCGEACD